jgi:hypothetical protein
MTQTPMRVAAVLIAVFLVAGCALRGVPGTDGRNSKEDNTPGLPIRGDMTMEWLHVGHERLSGGAVGLDEQPGHHKKEQMVFKTKEEMHKVWLADRGNEATLPYFTPEGATGATKPREVDFDKEMVVAVFAGQAQCHCGIRIERVLPKGDGVVVEFREYSWNSGVAPPPTCPCQVVVVDKVAGKVEFKELPPDNPPFAPVP